VYGASGRDCRVLLAGPSWREAGLVPVGGDPSARHGAPGVSMRLYDGSMGSYSTLKIRNVVFESWKNGVDDSIMILFSESEKRIQEIASDTDDQHSSSGDEQSELPRVEYITTAETLKKRLDFLGFTFDTCSQVFEIAREREITQKKMLMSDMGERLNITAKDLMSDFYSKRIDLLSRYDSKAWLSALRESFRASTDIYPSLLPELEIFPSAGASLYQRFPEVNDERFRLRFELEAIEKGEAILDISDLVDGGYYSPSDPLSSWAREWASGRGREAIHLIVLTEGSTDRSVLEPTLKALRPELAEYISFMDFAAFKVEGGASFLASVVRSFAGAGIRDRIVAVFDNDTAGCAAQDALLKHALPQNIKVIRYPDIDLAREYPTIGPSGSVTMDVNGSAASIELYLGRDVLANPSGELVPVQWKGFDSNMKRHQGEVLNKRECRQRFLRKLNTLRQSGNAPGSSEWGDLSAILNTICSAFEAIDRDFLLEYARETESG